jgi:hypothetical protein
MRNAEDLHFWRVSKANAAQMASSFTVLGLVLAVIGAAPAWSAFLFILALLSGARWYYRWHGDRKLAQRSRALHTTLRNTPQA